MPTDERADVTDGAAHITETALVEVTPNLAAAYLDMVEEFEAAG